jgi:hypothetical protein
MNGRRGRSAVTAFGVAVLSLVAAPAPAFGLMPGVCADVPGGDGQGPTGTVNTDICQGSGVMFVGPQIGQVASVIGPTVIGPVSGVAVNTAAGGIAGNTGSATILPLT